VIQALKKIDWRVFAVLLGAGLLGVLAILPYVMDLLGTSMLDRGSAPDIPFPLVVLLSLLQNGVLLAVAIAIGMILSERVGLQMPFIRGWIAGKRARNVRAFALPGIAVGAAVGAVLVGTEAMFFLRHLPAAMRPAFEIALWKRLLAGVVYGGITEELLMRLFLMSLTAWLFSRRWQTREGLPTTGAFWAAVVLVAIVFGLGHLPATSLITPLTPLIVARALVLNVVAGIAFGWLFWKYGLEAAMLGHMSAHVVMQAPGVMLLRAIL
jgi:Type II CAAX prenyl endopeptidase Rce1-like